MRDFLIDHLSDFEIALWSFPVLLVLIGLRIPLAAAMFIVGLVASYLVDGHTRMIDNQLKTFVYGTLTNYSFTIIPLFLLMSEFATRSGMSHALFKAAEAWLGHKRGGLPMAAIGASAGFGAICGSSLATASSMGRVALPELQRAGYSGSLATGALAAGGTLGILIPPSIVLIIYAILAEENIEKLFTAALVPGVLAMLGYMVTIGLYTRLVKGGGTIRQAAPYSARLRALIPVWPVIVIFALVIGGIYAGVFSPSAAAGVGVAGMAVVTWAKKKMTWVALKQSLLSTAKTSAMIFFIILAAGVYNSFLASAQLPQTLARALLQSSLSPWLILIGILLLYLLLGTVMDSLAMIFLTVPVFVPIIAELDFGLPMQENVIWFGILVLMSAEIGLITPPVGLNLFVINAMSSNVSISETYRGALPFVASDLIRVAVLVAFPSITMFLVRLLF